MKTPLRSGFANRIAVPLTYESKYLTVVKRSVSISEGALFWKYSSTIEVIKYAFFKVRTNEATDQYMKLFLY